MDERDLLRALRRAVEAGRVGVALDYRRLDQTDSPISLQADSNRWIYGIAAVTVGAGLARGWAWAAAAAALGLGAYAALGRPWLRRRMDRRFRELALRDVAAFKKLWRLRGVRLIDRAGPAACDSPDGDWRRFVLDRLRP